MGKVFKSLSFDEWVRHVFDHPVAKPAWHWEEDADEAELEPQQIISYATALFDRAGQTLGSYTDDQVNQGLWFLIGEGSSPLYPLAEQSIPLKLRVDCILSIQKLYEQCFVPRCTAHLSHLDEPGSGPLNSVCYMWWDIFPLYGQPENYRQSEIDDACLSVMETTLKLPSIACQESALHGLGHWGVSYQSRGSRIISDFLERQPDLRDALREYAEQAMKGNVN